MSRWVVLIVVVILVVCGFSGLAASDCPRPSELTAPWVGPWFYVEHGPTYVHIDVHFTLHDQFGDRESPLYLYRAADRVWRSTVDFEQQETACLDEYKQLVDFSLTVLNEGERPFTYDNQDMMDDYEAFLLSHHDWLLYFPIVYD